MNLNLTAKTFMIMLTKNVKEGRLRHVQSSTRDDTSLGLDFNKALDTESYAVGAGGAIRLRYTCVSEVGKRKVIQV
jgi:hypothetical protein